MTSKEGNQNSGWMSSGGGSNAKFSQGKDLFCTTEKLQLVTFCCPEVFPHVCCTAWHSAKATTFTATLPSKLMYLQGSRACWQRLHAIRNLPTVHTYVHVRGSGFDRWAAQPCSARA
ncbi:hypothetical protein CesoFtcFv8_027764 [Champsocephalus esox]|uniref:Uncharacterized protein n=1 Tax=Champsocephalus esox TaxID=159716 RepID=A0AAN8AZ03_9TELE|nr:hypothetical protein CesoFtcFv8_027764 [Champsocephalus esox]